MIWIESALHYLVISSLTNWVVPLKNINDNHSLIEAGHILIGDYKYERKGSIRWHFESFWLVQIYNQQIEGREKALKITCPLPEPTSGVFLIDCMGRLVFVAIDHGLVSGIIHTLVTLPNPETDSWYQTRVNNNLINIRHY